jgi:hypothetical protein
MELQVKDPVTGVLLPYTAKPERLHELHGFRIIPPNGSSFFIASRGGAWRVMDGHVIAPELLVNIGLALEHQPLREQVGLMNAANEGYDTDNQPNLNSGIGDVALTDPNEP